MVRDDSPSRGRAQSFGMDLEALRSAARAHLDDAGWQYYQGVADGRPDTDLDADAWAAIHLVPRVLQGLTAVDTSVALGGSVLSTPVMVAATAAHELADRDGETATAAGAASAGALMVYSASASVEVTAFGAIATSPWWAQVYLMSDRRLTDDYLARAVAAGAGAVVLTVDNAGTLADAPFRTSATTLTSVPANYPGMTWAEMSASIEPGLVPADIGRMAQSTGLPVHVKGVLHPADAVLAVEAGAAGVVVSNHGRRQVAGVVPTALVLAEIVAAVDGRVPVMVDGGIRSGIDVVRAVALGAAAVGVGRPVLWGLAAGGSSGVASVLTSLTAELRQAMASLGAPVLGALNPSMVRLPRC